jgi:hypothetical protein
VLSYSSKAWTICKRDKRIRAAEIKFRRTAGYKTKEDIMMLLNIQPIMQLTENYRAKWKKHVL